QTRRALVVGAPGGGRFLVRSLGSQPRLRHGSGGSGSRGVWGLPPARGRARGRAVACGPPERRRRWGWRTAVLCRPALRGPGHLTTLTGSVGGVGASRGGAPGAGRGTAG